MKDLGGGKMNAVNLTHKARPTEPVARCEDCANFETRTLYCNEHEVALAAITDIHEIIPYCFEEMKA